MTFPPGTPPGGPFQPNGQQAPPPSDPRTASRPFSFQPGAGPAPQYPVGAAPIGPSSKGPAPHGPGQNNPLPNNPGQNGPVPNGPGALGGMPGLGPERMPGGPPGHPGPAQPYPTVRASSRWVVVLRSAAVVLVALGLSIPFDSSCDWAARTTWAIFAIVAAVAQLISSTGGSFGWDVRRSWLIGAVATGALTLHWLLIALPNVGSNAGFCLTFGTAAAIGGMLLAPGRRW